MIEVLNATDYWYSLPSLWYLGCQFGYGFIMPLDFFCSVFTPQSRDWVLGSGYCVILIPGLPRIRNAILIMISITFSIICSLAFSLSS